MRGDVWLSTLSKCREYEDAARGDRYEGTLTYLHEELSPERYADVPGGYDYAISQTHVGKLNPGVFLRFEGKFGWRTELPDCWILCCTKSFSPETFNEDFGRYCVKINDPGMLYRKLTRRLFDEQLIEKANGNSVFGGVIYEDREYKDLEAPPGPIGLVKPKRYSPQEEIRMLWRPIGGIEAPLMGRLLKLPSARHLFERVA